MLTKDQSTTGKSVRSKAQQAWPVLPGESVPSMPGSNTDKGPPFDYSAYLNYSEFLLTFEKNFFEKDYSHIWQMNCCGAAEAIVSNTPFFWKKQGASESVLKCLVYAHNLKKTFLLWTIPITISSYFEAEKIIKTLPNTSLVGKEVSITSGETLLIYLTNMKANWK